MKASDQSRVCRVTTRAEAIALDHPVRSRLLMACVQRAQSLTQLARQLSQPLSKLHYHLGRLVGCGLLVVARTEQRPGRPIRYYRAVAKTFSISLADVKEIAGHNWSRELRQSLSQQYNRKNLSQLYELDEAGRYRIRLTDSDGRGQASRTFEHWKMLHLTRQQRSSLADELQQLISRYNVTEEGSDSELVIVHAAFAPKIWNA